MMENMEKKEEIGMLRYFHGHLGPNLIAGYRMGKIARAAEPRDISAKVYCGSSPPPSCLIDGIQLSSCCTMGKGNIEIAGEGELKAVFSYGDGSKVTIKVREEAKERMYDGLSHETEEQKSMEVLEMPEEELFEVIRE